MIEIPLTQGQVALIDDEDFDLVRQYKWFADFAKNTQGFYARANSPTVNGKRKGIRMHRLILGITDPRVLCDHIDHNGLNNQRNNIRVCTYQENRCNAPKPCSNTSGYKGVVWHGCRKKWRATIKIEGRRVSLGLFKTPEEAHAAYCEAAVRYHGEFAHF
jgi:hypothetical protein